MRKKKFETEMGMSGGESTWSGCWEEVGTQTVEAQHNLNGAVKKEKIGARKISANSRNFTPRTYFRELLKKREGDKRIKKAESGKGEEHR